MHGIEEEMGSGANPPGATRMVVFAFLVFNLSLGCMFGPFGVLVSAIEERLQVTREVSTLAVPVVTFGMALLAPLAGGLANRVSLRLLMMAGSLSMVMGFALLAVANSVPLFIGAYALLIGPALSLCGAVAPPTLVTRWFRVNRGRALGIAATPALMAVMPLMTAFVLTKFGLAAVYWLFAAIMVGCFVISALVIDYPPTNKATSQPQSGESNEPTAGELPVNSLLASSRFWRLAIAAGLYNSIIVMFSTSLVPFATGIGIEPTMAAMLLTAYLVGTLVGTPLVGWAADKVGGVQMITILCFTLALWQGLLVTHPGFVILLLITWLAGLQGSAMLPSLGLSLSNEFGRESFAKAFGISNLVGLPFAVLSVPVASAIFVRSGSYDGAFLLSAAMLATGMVLALTMVRGARVSRVPAS